MAAIPAIILPMALAQPGRGGCPGMAGYDKSTETTISGTVQDLQPCPSADAMISREVTKDGKKLTLRDDTGRPLWRAAGR